MKTIDEKPDKSPPAPVEANACDHPAGTAVGASSGALLGGMVGALGGPVTAIVGAAAGAIAGANAGFNVAESLEDGKGHSPSEDAGDDQEASGHLAPETAGAHYQSTPQASLSRVPDAGDSIVISEPRDAFDTGGFSSEGQRQLLSEDHDRQ